MTAPKQPDTTHSINTIAVARTPFEEKFAVPRQPNLAPHVEGTIQLIPPYDHPDYFIGLEGVSHIWLLFIFHHININKTQSSKVRPPRLGGNKKIGVFATRSTHRPNRIGQSVVRLLGIENTTLHVAGIDLIDETPIIDIKPYIPYSDAIPQAINPVAQNAPTPITVEWTPRAVTSLLSLATNNNEMDVIRTAITECLAQDPRPSYSKLDKDRTYGVNMYNLNINWQYKTNDLLLVTDIHPE